MIDFNNDSKYIRVEISAPICSMCPWQLFSNHLLENILKVVLVYWSMLTSTETCNFI